MAIKSLKACLDGSTPQTSNVNENHKVDEDLTGAPQSKKRKGYQLSDSRSSLNPDTVVLCLANVHVEWPITIGDSDSEKVKKGQRRHRKIATPHQKIASNNSITVEGLLRSSEKIVVISGAGISTNAGCELNYDLWIFLF
jgi:hypothetical protein